MSRYAATRPSPATRRAGLLLDRIDIHVEAPRVEYDKLAPTLPLRPMRQAYR
ncbi:MAG: hypothetical protein JXA42_14465 [Anaerolineales bacterium]|nr:hypothetical protein [Anaerolineales bacterium]